MHEILRVRAELFTFTATQEAKTRGLRGSRGAPVHRKARERSELSPVSGPEEKSGRREKRRRRRTKSLCNNEAEQQT